MSERKKSRRGLRVLVILLCIVLVLAGCGYFAMSYVLGHIHHISLSDIVYLRAEDETFEADEEGAERATQVLSPDQVRWDTAESMHDKNVFNILLIGQDRREGESRARSDSMILVSVNTKANTITLVSFLRDLYVQIPGYSDNRINAAYAWGGMKLLNETIALNFGLTVDGDVEVDFSQFETIVDILGGVDVQLTSAEAGYLQNTMQAGSMHEGMNHLSGSQALLYARMRKLDSDFGRTQRQRSLILSVASSLRSASLSQLMDLVTEVLPYVTTDMTQGEIVSYATRAAKVYLAGGELTSLRIPADGAYQFASIREMSVLVPDLASARATLKEALYSQS